MATSTLLQKIFAADESGVGEDSVLDSNRRQVETFICSEAIDDGDIVCLDISKSTDGEKMLYVKKANTGAGATTLTIGVADQSTGEAGDTVRVVIKGFKKDANVATGGNTGDRIVGSSTGGRATQYAASSTQAILGYQLEAAAANKADVYIIKQF